MLMGRYRLNIKNKESTKKGQKSTNGGMKGSKGDKEWTLTGSVNAGWPFADDVTQSEL
jgi:hypothetical protein